MKTLSFKNISPEKTLIYVLFGVALIVFVFVGYLFISYGSKSIQLIFPQGGEELKIGETYQIKWKAKKINRIGIVLFSKDGAKWLAKNIKAKEGKYDWIIYPGQELGGGYALAVLEYPWKKGNKISYSEGTFAITYPKTWSCDDLSKDKEWPYLPSDLPNLRRVFITEKEYSGDLGGLNGADKKCQEEAESMGLKGKWQAFLGGDGENETALKRMEKTPRGTKGIFVEANPSSKLLRGATCHRLLGRDINSFLAKLSSSLVISKIELGETFFNDLSNVWLGRIGEDSKKNCIGINSVLSNAYMPLAEKYSFTDTCQNWTKNNNYVNGYSRGERISISSFPTCYTVNGIFTNAVGLAGLAEGVMNNKFFPNIGKSCDTKQHLICIEE